MRAKFSGVTRRALAIAVLAALTACGGAADSTGSGADEIAATPTTGGAAAPEDRASPESAPEAADAKPVTVKFTEHGEGGEGTLDFSYRWPAQVSAIPALAQRLERERKDQEAKWRDEWNAALADSPEGCVSCRSRGYDKRWEVVANLPNYLSLSASIYSYLGGAHGGTVFDALVWDRAGGRAIRPIDMFRSAASIDNAVRDAFCDALDKARVRKRGGPVKRTGDPFYDCIDPVANSTVIVGSAGGRRFDRIGFLIPPYNAGPYAEGTYEVTLDMTPALLDAVRPEYRRAFQVP